MSKEKDSDEGSVRNSPDYQSLVAFNEQLLDENSHLGKIISSASMRKGSERIQRAIMQTIVNNGHGAMIQHARPRA
jgi:hypothetical protein